MTTTTKNRRPEIVVAEVAPARPVASIRKRKRGQYIALNGVAMVIIAAIALTLIGILYLMQTAKVASLGYQFSNLQNQYYSLSLDNSKLGYQVARDQSLDTISRIAIEQLGMTPLKNFRFLQVQRPANDNLPPVPSDVQPRPSLWQRVRSAIIGESSASVHEQVTTTTSNVASATPQASPATTPQAGIDITPQSTVGTAP